MFARGQPEARYVAPSRGSTDPRVPVVSRQPPRQVTPSHHAIVPPNEGPGACMSQRVELGTQTYCRRLGVAYAMPTSLWVR